MNKSIRNNHKVPIEQLIIPFRIVSDLKKDNGRKMLMSFILAPPPYSEAIRCLNER